MKRLPAAICVMLLPVPAVCQTAPGAKLASLFGRTTEPGGEPLRKVYLTLTPVAKKTGDRSPYGAMSDAQGNFAFNGVEPGS